MFGLCKASHQFNGLLVCEFQAASFAGTHVGKTSFTLSDQDLRRLNAYMVRRLSPLQVIDQRLCNNAGANEKEQLARIIQVLGLPPKSMIDASLRQHVFFEPDGTVKWVPISGSKYSPGERSLNSALGTTDEYFADFMKA